ncbi:MAG: hypothetical protein WAM28_01120, partial [Chlamydiales bacterium]
MNVTLDVLNYFLGGYAFESEADGEEAQRAGLEREALEAGLSPRVPLERSTSTATSSVAQPVLQRTVSGRSSYQQVDSEKVVGRGNQLQMPVTDEEVTVEEGPEVYTATRRVSEKLEDPGFLLEMTDPDLDELLSQYLDLDPNFLQEEKDSADIFTGNTQKKENPGDVVKEKSLNTLDPSERSLGQDNLLPSGKKQSGPFVVKASSNRGVKKVNTTSFFTRDKVIQLAAKIGCVVLALFAIVSIVFLFKTGSIFAGAALLVLGSACLATKVYENKERIKNFTIEWYRNRKIESIEREFKEIIDKIKNNKG